MTPPCVVGTIGRHGADVFAHGDFPQQVWQNWAVAVYTRCERHRPDVGRASIQSQMDHAPLATVLNTVFASLTFTVTEELDPGVVHEQIERPIGAPIRDLDAQRLLQATTSGVMKHLPIQNRHLEQAGYYPGRLPEWHFERQAELDLGVLKELWPPLKRREPDHILLQPDQQRPALSERGTAIRPLGCAVAGGVRLAHAVSLTDWIRHVNPLPLEPCNNAHSDQRFLFTSHEWQQFVSQI